MSDCININQEAIDGTCKLYFQTQKKMICMEELGELIRAISKVERESDEKWKSQIRNETEEIADVLICIRMLMCYDGISETDIQNAVNFKQTRQMLRDYIRFSDNPSFKKGNEEYFKMCQDAYSRFDKLLLF